MAEVADSFDDEVKALVGFIIDQLIKAWNYVNRLDQHPEEDSFRAPVKPLETPTWIVCSNAS